MRKHLKAFSYSLYCTMLRVGHNDPWVVVPSGCSGIFDRRPSRGRHQLGSFQVRFMDLHEIVVHIVIIWC